MLAFNVLQRTSWSNYTRHKSNFRAVFLQKQNKSYIHSWLLDGVAQHSWLPQAIPLAPENLERQDMVDAVMVAVMMAMEEGMELCHQVVAERN
jgi:hypothetical protein